MKLSREEIYQRIISVLKPLGVRKISVFGSLARGESPVHDIDLLVDVPSEIGLRWFSLPEELEEVVGMPVDLVSEKSISPYFRRCISPELQVIYEKAG